MPVSVLLVSSLCSALNVLATLLLFLPLLLLREGWPPARLGKERKPLRLQVIGPDGPERTIDVARDLDELTAAFQRQQFARETGVVLWLHPRAG